MDAPIIDSLNGVALITRGVSSCAVIDGGTGFIINPMIVFSGGGGIGADASVTIDVITGSIKSIEMISTGCGYTSDPDVLIYGGGGNGAIISCTLDTGFLMRFGYCDFTTDPNWDDRNFTQQPKVPYGAVCFNDAFDQDKSHVTKLIDGQWVLYQ